MAAYIDHAAYAVRDLDWHRRFFREVLGMEEEKSRVSPEGLALEWGCETDSRPGWLRLPEGLWLELFEAREGAISALLDLPRRKN